MEMITFHHIMNSEKAAAAIYRDFEKLYRLSALYKDDPRQIQQQLSYINNNLEAHLAGGFGRSGAVKFDLLMSSVYSGGEEVFKSETPEFTISYALFYEGVKSLVFLGGLTAEELLNWMITVKNVLKDSGEYEGDDLASVLWRKSSPNIKVSLYNVFSQYEDMDETQMKSLDVGDDSGEFEEAFVKEILESEFQEANKNLDTSWQERDLQWDLPSGDMIVEKLGSLGVLDDNSADRLKKELSDSAVSDRAKKILRFAPQEIQSLRKELESYDENQVEFNVMAHYLSLLESPDFKDQSSIQFISASVREIIQGIIKRFHAGLLLFTLRRIRGWKSKPELADRFDGIEPELRASLSDEKNLQVLGEAFGTSSRIKIATELIQYLDAKYYQYAFSVLTQSGNIQGQKNFMNSLIKMKAPLDQMVLAWSEKELLASFSILSEKNWKGRNNLMVRALRSRQPRVSDLACEHIGNIQLKGLDAIKIFSRMRPTAQRKWLHSVSKMPKKETWQDFVKLGFQSKIWLKAEDDLMELWILLAFKYLGVRVRELFSVYVEGRNMLFWPKFKKERELILSLALSRTEPEIKRIAGEWAQSEKSLIFQSAELKQSLRERA